MARRAKGAKPAANGRSKHAELLRQANLKVDWTEAHREDVKAGVQSAVKPVLITRGVKPADFGGIVLRHAPGEALYRDWPMVA